MLLFSNGDFFSGKMTITRHNFKERLRERERDREIGIRGPLKSLAIAGGKMIGNLMLFLSYLLKYLL